MVLKTINTTKRVSTAVCKKQTLKNTLHNRLHIMKHHNALGKKKKGNDGNMYIYKMSVNYGHTRWIKA